MMDFSVLENASAVESAWATFSKALDEAIAKKRVESRDRFQLLTEYGWVNADSYAWHRFSMDRDVESVLVDLEARIASAVETDFSEQFA